MGDLIIKPESGGSIKLQNNAGTNALVSDNSGNITLAGATTLTGNVTLSGTANNLGTVTAGSIAGGTITSATTFPAGHVLQVKSTYVTDRNSSTATSTSGTGTDCGLNVTITPVSSTSDFLITLSIGKWGSPDSNSMGMILSKDGAKIGNGVDSSSRNGIFTGGVKWSWNDSNHADGASAHYLDTVSGSSARTYKCGFVVQGGTGYINRNGSNSDNDSVYSSYTGSSLTVMEIQGA